MRKEKDPKIRINLGIFLSSRSKSESSIKYQWDTKQYNKISNLTIDKSKNEFQMIDNSSRFIPNSKKIIYANSPKIKPNPFLGLLTKVNYFSEEIQGNQNMKKSNSSQDLNKIKQTKKAKLNEKRNSCTNLKTHEDKGNYKSKNDQKVK